MTLTHIEVVFCESAPFVSAFQQVLVAEEYADLPAPFLEALAALHRSVDYMTCACGDPIGFVLVYRPVTVGPEEIVEWKPTALAREDGGPVVVLCEDCAPYIPTSENPEGTT